MKRQNVARRASHMSRAVAVACSRTIVAADDAGRPGFGGSAQVRVALDEAAKAGGLLVRTSYGFRFSHDLIRASIYGSLLISCDYLVKEPFIVILTDYFIVSHKQKKSVSWSDMYDWSDIDSYANGYNTFSDEREFSSIRLPVVYFALTPATLYLIRRVPSAIDIGQNTNIQCPSA
jgi:hypothetical protein